MDALFRRPWFLARYYRLPFGAWLDSFVADLQAQEYRTGTVRHHLHCLLGFGEFLRNQGFHTQDLVDQEAIAVAYLEHCNQQCLARHGRALRPGYHRQFRWALGLLVKFAQKAGHLPPPRAAPPAGPSRLEDFLEFVRIHRGLGPSALWIYRHWLERLQRFLLPALDLGEASLEELDRFTAQVGRQYSRSTTHRVVGAIRCFLRYRFLMGWEPSNRSPLLEYPVVYRQMRLPCHLTEAQLQAALGRIDRSSPIGKRDWAVWMLLTSYGLRAGEVASLRQVDVDWDARRLSVQRLKGGTLAAFPMTSRVEEALRDYLDAGRPNTSHQTLFVTHQAPIVPFGGGSNLSQSCVRKYLRSDSALPSHGAHILRHTLACQLRERGATVGAIRNVLGHRDVDTTAGYLRLALEELREVADNYADLLP